MRPLQKFIAAVRAQLRRIELPALLLLAGAALGVWLFVEVADAVMEGETGELDERLLLALRNPADLNDPLGPGWVEEMARDFTALGGVAVLLTITCACLAYLVLAGQRHAAWLVLLTVSGGLVISTLLKMGFDRARPELVAHLSHVYSASFPSGHSMMAAVVYLTLGALLARMHAQRRLKLFFLAIAALLTALVGLSRVYLGVHWPTDVLAGWAVGAAWALACWLAALWLQQRGLVERPAR